jgi:hypothetical protein
MRNAAQVKVSPDMIAISMARPIPRLAAAALLSSRSNLDKTAANSVRNKIDPPTAAFCFLPLLPLSPPLPPSALSLFLFLLLRVFLFLSLSLSLSNTYTHAHTHTIGGAPPEAPRPWSLKRDRKLRGGTAGLGCRLRERRAGSHSLRRQRLRRRNLPRDVHKLIW